MHQQRHADFFHGGERCTAFRNRGDARIRIRGRAGRIIFHAVNKTAMLGRTDFRGGRVIGQIQRHQGIKGHGGWYRRQYARAIRLCRIRGRHRRFEIRHDDGAGETARGIRQHRRHQ